MMPWIKPHAEAELARWPVRALSPSTDVYEADDKKLEGILQFHAFQAWIGQHRTVEKRAAFPGAVGHGTAIAQLRDYSRNARLIWSVNGFIRNEMTVRSVVRMNASTGMPGLRLSGSNEPSLPSSSLIRTV